jgi:hypothetical protein
MTVTLSVPRSSEGFLNELIAEVQDSRHLAMRRTSLWELFAKYGCHTPIVTFNYHGAYSTSLENDVFDLVDISGSHADEDPLNKRFAALDVSCGINNGVLTLSVIYSACLHEEGEVDVLVRM